MEIVYPKGHVTRIMALNSISFIIGLAVAAAPFVKHFFPGDVDTTAHVAVGMLIVVLAIFRVLLGYGSTWIDFCLFWLGLIVFQFPSIMHMHWDSAYTGAHMAGGGIVMVIALISFVMTLPVRRAMKQA